MGLGLELGIGSHRRQRLGHLPPLLLRPRPSDRRVLRQQTPHLRRVAPLRRRERAARLVEHEAHVAQLHMARVDELPLHWPLLHIDPAQMMPGVD